MKARSNKEHEASSNRVVEASGNVEDEESSKQ